MRILVTGGAGFIGSNFLRFLIDNYPHHDIVVLDKLTYCGRIENLEEIKHKITFVKGDINDEDALKKAFKDIDTVIHFAAESHVDNSILDPGIFVRTNILGTFNLLEMSRKKDVKAYIQINTDEVYGSTLKGLFKETDILDPSSPYSSSKAGSGLLSHSYFKTYGMNIKETRSSNNYGPRQFPEKLIPKIILKALHDEKIPVYGTGKNIRDWIHVLDNCNGIYTVLEKGKAGEVYNIGAGEEHTNLEIVKNILKILEKPESLIEFVADRPGHDFRYALDISKISKLGWTPTIGFEEGLKKTVDWYVENKKWWAPLKRQ